MSASKTSRTVAVVLAAISIVRPPDLAAQTPISAQVEALGRAAIEARGALDGRLSIDGSSVQLVDATERTLVGCAKGWTDLTLWRATPGAPPHGDGSVAVVRGVLYPVGGLGISNLGGLVDALLLGGRSDHQKATIECLVETIVSMLTIPGEDTYDTASPPSYVGTAQVSPQIRDSLPTGWPSPGMKAYGDIRVVVFTVFDLQSTPRELYFRPTAYALVFSLDLRLLSWALRRGAPIELHRPK